MNDDIVTQLRKQIRINQQYANKKSQRQYNKQRQIITYEVGDQVNVVVSTLDRAFIDDKRLFEKIIVVREKYDSY